MKFQTLKVTIFLACSLAFTSVLSLSTDSPSLLAESTPLQDTQSLSTHMDISDISKELVSQAENTDSGLLLKESLASEIGYFGNFALVSYSNSLMGLLESHLRKTLLFISSDTLLSHKPIKLNGDQEVLVTNPIKISLEGLTFLDESMEGLDDVSQYLFFFNFVNKDPKKASLQSEDQSLKETSIWTPISIEIKPFDSTLQYSLVEKNNLSKRSNFKKSMSIQNQLFMHTRAIDLISCDSKCLGRVIKAIEEGKKEEDLFLAMPIQQKTKKSYRGTLLNILRNTEGEREESLYRVLDSHSKKQGAPFSYAYDINENKITTTGSFLTCSASLGAAGGSPSNKEREVLMECKPVLLKTAKLAETDLYQSHPLIFSLIVGALATLTVFLLFKLWKRRRSNEDNLVQEQPIA